MPRPLFAALASAGLLGALGIASALAFRAFPAERPPPLPAWVPLVWTAGAALLLVASWRRAGRLVRALFRGALAVAVLLGTAGAPMMGTIAVLDASPVSFALFGLVLAVTGLHALVAYGLSRPVSKAWFRPARDA